MADQARATFGGKPCFWPEDGFFALELGVSPSRGAVLMRADHIQELAPENSAFALLLEDGVGGSVTIADLYVERVELASAGRTEDPVMVTVQFHDKRQLGKFADPLAGQRNVLREDKETYVTHTVNGAEPWTFDELVQECLDKLGWNVTAATGITWVPQNVTWEAANPAAALEQLLREVGWDVALQPDGTFALVDLAQPGASFTPTLPVTAHVVRPHDRAHEKPATAEVWFRILREKSLTCEAVMQDTGETDAAKDGEWRTIQQVATNWGVSEAQLAKLYYPSTSPGAAIANANKLGGGTLGAARLGRIRAQLYRFFRVSETDRAKILPLVPIRTEVATGSGRQVYLGAKPGDAITYHVFRGANEGMGTDGAPKQDTYFNHTGQPPFPVMIRDAREGIIEFQSGQRPIAKVVRQKPGAMEQDYTLEVGVVKVVAGFWKKFEDPADGEGDYYIVSRAVGGPNNGGRKVFLAPEPYVREHFADQDGYVADNQDAVDDAANGFLDAYVREFDLPAAEEYVCEGVDAGDALGPAVRAIRWDFGGKGWRTSYRLFDDASAVRGGRAPHVKAKEFAMEAERVRLVTPSGPGGGRGGSGGGGDLGSLSNESPLLKDHEGGQRAPLHGFDENQGGWVTDMRGDMLCAEDLTMDPSGETPCKPSTQSTGGGGDKVNRGAGVTGSGSGLTSGAAVG